MAWSGRAVSRRAALLLILLVLLSTGAVVRLSIVMHAQREAQADVADLRLMQRQLFQQQAMLVGHRRRQLPRVDDVDVLAVVPTIPRPNSEGYLQRTLASIVEQIHKAHPFDAATAAAKRQLSVRILVFKPSPQDHVHFEEARQFWLESEEGIREAESAGILFSFVDHGDERLLDPDPLKPEPDHSNNPLAIPGHTARQQNCDLLSLMRYALQRFGFKYLLFLEDDFLVCDDGWARMEEAVAKVAREPPLIPRDQIDGLVGLLVQSSVRADELPAFLKPEARAALEAIVRLNSTERIRLAPTVVEQLAVPFRLLRMSYGMEGILLHWIDAKAFADHLEANLANKPIDLLVDSFLFPDKQEHPELGYMHLVPPHTVRRILMEHIGTSSTYEERNSADYRRPIRRCNTGNSGGALWQSVDV